jgi:GAF domain-containing protein
MRIASVPLNEELRLQDLYTYDILDSQQDAAFDELLEVAASIYGCPIAAISFIDKERQWFKSKIGLPADTESTTRDVSFCAHTILNDEVMIVKDATKDERFCQNPFVTEGLQIRFYAGAPIVSAKGYSLGSICIIDHQPRELTQHEARMLQILSNQISKLLELRLKNRLLKKKPKNKSSLKNYCFKKQWKNMKQKNSLSAGSSMRT